MKPFEVTVEGAQADFLGLGILLGLGAAAILYTLHGRQRRAHRQRCAKCAVKHLVEAAKDASCAGVIVVDPPAVTQAPAAA